VTIPWFECAGDDITCWYRNFTGTLRDALACATDVGAASTAPNALFDRLEAALADPSYAAADAARYILFISADDDQSTTMPSADIARAVGVVGGASTPRLDQFAAMFPGLISRASIDEPHWDNAFYHLFEPPLNNGRPNPCLSDYVPGTTVRVDEHDGTEISPCIMATDTRPLATTPLPCHRVVPSPECSETGGWAIWVERRTFSRAFATARYECAPP
jgi:hypothetical protein